MRGRLNIEAAFDLRRGHNKACVGSSALTPDKSEATVRSRDRRIVGKNAAAEIAVAEETD